VARTSSSESHHDPFRPSVAVAIDRERPALRTASGLEVTTTRWVLATVSYPFVPPLPAVIAPHAHVYRTIEDLEAFVCERP